MKIRRILLAATAAAVCSSAYASSSINKKLDDIEERIDGLEETQSEISKHDGDDNIKWGIDIRTAYDNVDYTMADGSSKGNDALGSIRLWLNMAYSPDDINLFYGQLSVNKAFGADFNGRGSFGDGASFDWTGNEALGTNTVKVRQAYWVHLGEKFFGADVPWSVSAGRRPSTNGFPVNLSQDDKMQSSLGHLINVEVDAVSLKTDFSKVTGIPGFYLKLCAGYGSTDATPKFASSTPYASGEDPDSIDNVVLTSLVFQLYNDSRYIVKGQAVKAYNLPGQEVDPIFTDASGNVVTDPTLATNVNMNNGSEFVANGDVDGFVLSGMIDGLTEEGYFADAKVLASFAMSKTNPDEGKAMLGSFDSETGTSYWVGAYLPVGEEEEYGRVGLEYNHGDQYWRPFTYAEDTMAGSKLATRGDAYEINYTYHFNEALSFQARYVQMDYDYAGSDGFFGNFSGNSSKISDIKAGANSWNKLSGGANPTDLAAINAVATTLGGTPEAMAQAQNMAGAAQALPNIVEQAKDFRFYVRYRF